MTDKKVMDLTDQTPSIGTLTELRVNLLPAAKAGLEALADSTEMSVTDVVNKSLNLFAFIYMMEEAGLLYYTRQEDGTYLKANFSNVWGSTVKEALAAKAAS